MLWQIIILGFSVLCLVYYALLCIRLRKWDSTFARFWLLCGCAGLMCGYLLKNKTDISRGAGIQESSKLTEASRAIRGDSWGFVLLALLLAGIFLLTEVKILRGMFPDRRLSGQQEDYRYLIVLGAQVDGKRITDSLRRRLERAVGYLREHPGTCAIVSGGMGRGEEIAEAEVMGAYLLEHGIEEERILREDRSRTTKENLEYSKAYIEDLSIPVGIVSNNFHLYRAVCYARQQGYERPCPVAADCHPLLFPNYIVREFFAVWKMRICEWRGSECPK
ncbi:YdcF family protein [Lachnospiraceae bacterium 56-18]